MTTSNTRSRRTAAPSLAVVASLCATGCYDGLADAAGDGEPTTTASSGDVTDESASATSGGETDGELPENEVDVDGPTLSLDGPCFAREASERAASVSPEGDLWLLREGGDGTAVRSLAPDGDAEIMLSLPWPVDVAQAWGRDHGTVLANGGLWSIEAGYAAPIRWPDAASPPSAACGDPSRDGDALVLAGDLFSRDVGQWWSWNLPAELSGAERLAASAGACAGEDGRAFLLRGDEVWTIESDWIALRPELGPAQALAADVGFGAATIVDEAVHLLGTDDATERIVFEAGPVHAVAAAPGSLWVRAGERLYVMADGEWVEAVDEAGSIGDKLVGVDDQGGVWLEREGEVCHRGPGPRIRVTGLRPYEHRRWPELVVELSAAEAPTVTLDGAALSVVEQKGAFAIETTVDEGWHTLDIEAGGAHRSLAFVVEGIVPATWEADIAPLFMAHCSGAGCHGPDPTGDERPDLSVYTTWVESADAIVERVVATGDMPPPGSGDGSFGVDDMLLVVGWIEAGLPESEGD